MSLIPTHGEVYVIQHYVRKFVSDLRQVGGFLCVLLFPPPIKHHHDITEILLKVTLTLKWCNSFIILFQQLKIILLEFF